MHRGEKHRERPGLRTTAVITYVDTSSLLKLVIDEVSSDQAGVIWDSADVVASAALVEVEGRAASRPTHRESAGPVSGPEPTLQDVR